MRNSLDTVLLDSKIFVDANIFLYAILGHPSLKPGCQKFLVNIENGLYRATTSSLVWKNYSELRKYPITIFSIDEEALNTAVLLSRKHGLLISDAVHAAIMKLNTITNIATNDSDFERIEGISVWKP